MLWVVRHGDAIRWSSRIRSENVATGKPQVPQRRGEERREREREERVRKKEIESESGRQKDKA